MIAIWELIDRSIPDPVPCDALHDAGISAAPHEPTEAA
jgi:hypothetical protein